MLFYNGKAHKLSKVRFRIPGRRRKRRYMEQWEFTSDDGRFEMRFDPVMDRSACTSVGVIKSDQHQIFGKFTGLALLDDGTEAPPGVEGEICVHGVPGRTLIAGYYNNEAATAELLDAEGWLHSGDEGYLDEDGWLYFLGRRGDMIKRSGENISALEVECVLTSHEAIADAAVIGVPDPIREQAVAAFVLPRRGTRVTEDELIRFCHGRLAKFKVPSYVEIMTEFPRSASGKVKKKVLRDIFCKGHPL